MISTYPEAFYKSFASIMPQFGFNRVKLMYTEEYGRTVHSSDIAVTVSVDGDLQGNVIYMMSESCAVRIASAMLGAPAETFERSQLAITKLAYLLADNACLALTGLEVTADISASTLMYGNFAVNLYHDHVVHFQAELDGTPFSIYVSLCDK